MRHVPDEGEIPTMRTSTKGRRAIVSPRYYCEGEGEERVGPCDLPDGLPVASGRPRKAVGTAHLDGFVRDGRGCPEALWRLVISWVEMAAPCLLRGGEFVRIDGK
jgi:hypothetical protein